MSNCDGEIDKGFAEALQNDYVYGHHYGWEFCGTVWWNGKEFIEVVLRHQSFVGEHRADTLENLMEKVNKEHGYK
jgi:hypothetical protein